MIPQGGFPPPHAVVFIICNMCIHAGAKCTTVDNFFNFEAKIMFEIAGDFLTKIDCSWES